MQWTQAFKVAGLACLLSLLISSFAVAGQVNINTADAPTIAKALTNIGLSKAEKIVAYRDEFGLFETPAAIVKVPGIGRKTFEKNKDNIVVETTSDE